MVSIFSELSTSDNPVTVNILRPDGSTLVSRPINPMASDQVGFTPTQPGVHGVEALGPGGVLIARDGLAIVGQALTPGMAGQTITDPWSTLQTGPGQSVMLHQVFTGPVVDGEAFVHVGPNSSVLSGAYQGTSAPAMPPVTSSVVQPGNTWTLSQDGRRYTDPSPFEGSTTTTIQSVQGGGMLFPSRAGFPIVSGSPPAPGPDIFANSLDAGWSAYTFLSVVNVGAGSHSVSVRFYDKAGNDVIADPIYRVSIQETGAGKLFVGEAVLGTLTARHQPSGAQVSVPGPGDRINLARVTITEAGVFSGVTQHPIDSSWPPEIVNAFLPAPPPTPTPTPIPGVSELGLGILAALLVAVVLWQLARRRKHPGASA